MEKASASWMVGAWRALICVGLDAEAVLEWNWRGGARVARGVLAGRTTHLPAGLVQLDEAALGAAGITPGAGVLSLKLEHHNATMLLWSPPQFCV